jgi:hypothetical protein
MPVSCLELHVYGFRVQKSDAAVVPVFLQAPPAAKDWLVKGKPRPAGDNSRKNGLTRNPRFAAPKSSVY